MPQTKNEISALLAAAGIHPRHRFGQNFMIDQNLVRIVAHAGMIAPGETVIEVGPGTGTLTEELLARGAHVIAVEIDRDLAKLLRERFADEKNFQLIEGDALESKHKLNPALLRACHLSGKPSAAPPVKLVANLPYNIASPLIIELLIDGVDLLAFTVQKEVADRLRASSNTEAYGPLSVMTQLLSKVEILRTLPPQAFWPSPKIESALVRLMRDDRLQGQATGFSPWISQIFSSRRKTLRNALARANINPQILDALGIDPQLRPESLTPKQYLKLYELSQQSRSAK